MEAPISRRSFQALAAALGAALLLEGSPSSADEKSTARPRRSSWGAVSVSLEDGHGRTLPTFVHHGRTFVLGAFGQRYQIRIRNPRAERVEAVVSVDGRDVINGSVGDFIENRGYVIAPHGSLVIEGFRTSLEEVATFRFTDPEDSYAGRRGTPQNVGVIGVALFAERVRPPVVKKEPPRKKPVHDEEAQAEQSKAPTPAPARAKRNLGTEFGEARVSRVGVTSFERATPRHPARIIQLSYDDADGLAARGIQVSPGRRGGDDEPEPFPHHHFAPPPPPRR